MINSRRPLLFLIFWALLSACWQLPSNFASLSLDDKVRSYESRFKRGGARNYRAEDLIISHGYGAAEAMAPHISGEKKGIPRFVALSIVRKVQLRGCDLRKSQALITIRNFLNKNHAQADERTAAEISLESIVNGLHSAPAAERLPAKVCDPTRGEAGPKQ